VEIKTFTSQPEDIDVSKPDLVKRLVDIIKRAPFEATQLLQLYDAISHRLVSKVCRECGKLGLEIEGRFIYPSGDMSKPKQFICRRCK
jgi:hypothetical protein